MTLQNLLLKLSRNKHIDVKCFVYDDKCIIEIKTTFNFDLLQRTEIDLNSKIDHSKFLNYL